VTHDEARGLFPVLERFAYLNAGTLGPLAQPTLDAVAERARFDHEQGRGGRAWFESMLELRTRVRQKLATLIGATPESLALTSSTTDGPGCDSIPSIRVPRCWTLATVTIDGSGSQSR
jgi:L-cysteine/cystine lyase